MKNVYGLLLRGAGKLEFCKNLEEHISFVPTEGQLLVEMKYAPINPSDYLFYKGYYPDKKPYPCIPGFEGFGVIVDAGDSEHKALVGKPCALMAFTNQHGTYASHTISLVKNTIILDELPNPETFEYLVNPITALGLLDEVHKHGSTVFLQNGASTSVGKLILFYNSLHQKMKSINIVRNDKHREELLALGATEVLNQTDADYLEKLTKSINEHKPSAVLDCLAGKATAEIFNRLPKGAYHWVYGILEMKPIDGINGAELLFTNKQLRGFHLYHSMIKDGGIQQYTNGIKECQNKFKQLPGIKAFETADFEQALTYYLQKKEKVLFKLS